MTATPARGRRSPGRALNQRALEAKRRKGDMF